MKTDIHYKQASKADIPDILRLYGQTEMDGEHTLSIEHAESLFDRIANYPYYHFYLAYQGELAVGVFGLLIMDNIAHQGTPSAIIEGVSVLDSCQGQGIGKAMMKKAMEICQRQGCYKIVLSSNSRRERAHTFYRNLGFEQHGISFKVGID